MSQFFIRDIEYTEDQIANLKQIELLQSNIHRMPVSLFKYFPNNSFVDDNGNKINYSLEALKNNTVFVSSPDQFDDPYDCNIYVDSNEFALQRIRYYASLCGVEVKSEWNYNDVAYHLAQKIYEHCSSGKPLESICNLSNENKIVHAHQERFLLNIKLELISPNANGDSYFIALNKVITRDFNEIQESANRFRISCFAQTQYSMLMWSHYARYHKGFCIEYEIPEYSNDYASIYHSLFPVIYTNKRIDLTTLSLNWKSTGSLSEDDLWDFYKYGLLSKSLDWKYQHEWRLISCDNLLSDDKYNCKFFKIKKVYLGNKMSTNDRLEVIEICKSKGIPYSGVIISPNQFEMKDCNILCENCNKMKQ